MILLIIHKGSWLPFWPLDNETGKHSSLLKDLVYFTGQGSITNQEFLSFHCTIVKSLQKETVTHQSLSLVFFLSPLFPLSSLPGSRFQSPLLEGEHLLLSAFSFHCLQYVPDVHGGFSSRVCSLERSGWTGQASKVAGVLQFPFGLSSSEQHG